jgi:lipid-A-disaccharide synthase-like uncharacterized protein
MHWNDAPMWLALGLAGQAAFFSRFLVQWVASERAGQSYVPVSFWYLSLVGSVVLLVYAIHRREPVFALGYLPNFVVYTRNLVLLRRHGARGSPSRAGGGGGGDAPQGS